MNTIKGWSKEKILLNCNIERCRELYDTKILFDGNTKNPFTQSVFMELVIRLRHIEQVFNNCCEDRMKNIRDAASHPWLNRDIEGAGIYLDFGKLYQGNWMLEENSEFKACDENCYVEFQYGSDKISTKEILELIEKFEKQIEEYEK